MKILHVVAYFPPDRIGGVGEVAAHLHAGLLAAGHESAVLTAGHTSTDPRVRRIASTPASFLLGLAGYAQVAGDYDLVHCHQGDALPLLAAMRAQRISVPFLVSVHVSYRGMAGAFAPYCIEGEWFARDAASWRYRQVKARLNDWATRAVTRLAQQAVFISRSAAVDSLGPAAGARACVIYNGLPPHAPPPETDAAVEPTELLYVGVGGHRKRVTALPFVLEHVRRALPTARLRLVGFELDSEPELREIFRRKNLLDAVRCEGKLRSTELARFYRAGGVLLVPSAYEGLPTVILEAFRQGLPCVATRVSGHPEVVDEGRNGFLVDLDRPEQMAERCVRILRDPDLRTAMSCAAAEMVETRFRLDRQVTEYLALYERLGVPS